MEVGIVGCRTGTRGKEEEEEEVGVVTSNDGTEVMESGAACRESYTRS